MSVYSVFICVFECVVCIMYVLHVCMCTLRVLLCMGAYVDESMRVSLCVWLRSVHDLQNYTSLCSSLITTTKLAKI